MGDASYKDRISIKHAENLYTMYSLEQYILGVCKEDPCT